MDNVILAFIIAFGGLFVIFSIMMVHQLSKRGVKINNFLIRFLIIKYIHQYKRMTLEETGKVGPLFYPGIISINMALGLTLLFLVLKIFHVF